MPPAGNRVVPFDAGSHFESVQGDLNSNAGGADIHLYYTKDAFPDDRAVTNVWFGSSSSGAVGKFGETDGYDLNRYAGDDWDPLVARLDAALPDGDGIQIFWP